MNSLDVLTLASATGLNVLSTDEKNLISKLSNQLLAKRSGNLTNQAYYDQKVLLKDLGISLPPQLKNMESVLGWPAKTVDVLADRIQFQGFHRLDSDIDYGLEQLTLENHLVNEFTHAVKSALTHSVAFFTIAKGDKAQGEPEVLILARDAYNATGIWNRRTRTLDAGLTVDGEDNDGTIARATVWLKDKNITIERGTGGKFFYKVEKHSVGRVLMEPIIHDPDLTRPFGRSRITPAVKTLTDSAIRTIVRSEVGAEFFATPQRYVLGADPDAIGNKWNALISRMPTITKDEDGDIPTVGQFPQISMQPHTDQLKQWAVLLAAESNIPLSELGFPSDNPESEPAIQSSRDPLRLRADNAIRSFQPALRNIAIKAVHLRDGGVPDELLRVSGWFAPTSHITDAAAADAVLKQVQVMPWLAESPVILEKLGYSADAIKRLLADKRKAQGGNLVDRVLNAATETAGEVPTL